MTNEHYDLETVGSWLATHMPDGTEGMQLCELGPGSARLRLAYGDHQLRPGGTLSGPTMMALADAAMYAAILAKVGPELLAVTTDFTIHFLNKPQPRDLEAHAQIIKLGRALIVLNVEITSGDVLVAHATGTYSRPPARVGAAS